MRNKLSYYSLVLLVGLAVTSAFILVMNPFSGAPARASPATQSTPTQSVANQNSPAVSNGTTPSAQGGNGFDNGVQPGGTSDGGHHHHAAGSFGFGGIAGNGSATTTTTANSVYSQNE
ncbi:MAG: hypothetical protein ACRD6W_13935 [Nitrososphaerales archaeon]